MTILRRALTSAIALFALCAVGSSQVVWVNVAYPSSGAATTRAVPDAFTLLGSGSLAFTAGGSNKSITLTPSGTGQVLMPTNGETLTVYRDGNGSLLSTINALTVNPGNGNIFLGGSHVLLAGLGTVGTGVLQFPAATTSAGGITFGTDFQVYRHQAGGLTVNSIGTNVQLVFRNQTALVGQFDNNATNLQLTANDGFILKTNNGTAVATFAALNNSGAGQIQITPGGTSSVGAVAMTISGGTVTNASGSHTALQIAPTYNQTSTAAATDLLINRTQTAVGSGAQLLIDAQVGGTSKFSLDNNGNAVFAASITGTNYTVGTGNNIAWSSRSRIQSNGDGQLQLTNAAQNDFGRLQLGGTTSSFPSIARSGTQLLARLADDSAYCGVRASKYLFVNGTTIQDTADGIIELSNNAVNDFTRLQFGGTTASFPSLKRSGTTLLARLADDSGYAPVEVGTLVTGGLITTYNGITTAGNGVVSVQGAGSVTAQTGASSSIATYTLGAADADFIVSGQVTVTAATTNSFSLECAYTDAATNTARVVTFNVQQLTGTLITAITNVTGVGPYEGVPLHLRAKASTAITIRTNSGGTYTSVTYSASAAIRKLQ